MTDPATLFNDELVRAYLATDDEPKRSAERVGTLVKHKPVPEKE